MGERRPAGEKEYSPLDDVSGLISGVLQGQPLPDVVEAPEPVIREEIKSEKILPISRATNKKPVVKEIALRKEELMTLKFQLPRADYAQARKILSQIEDHLQAKVDFSNLARGWITRLVTAEKAVLEAAKHHGKIKTANTRNPLEVAEVDHAMTVIQSTAFRRAEPIR